MVMGVVAQAGPTSALSLPGSSPEEKWEKLDPSSRESLTFWAFSIQRTFWASHGLCLACDIEFLSVPGHPIAHTLPQHWSCGFGSSAQGIPGSARLAKPTYSVPYKPVPHVSLNQSQRLSCLAGTRAVCFFHMVWALCLYLKVFLPFFVCTVEDWKFAYTRELFWCTQRVVNSLLEEIFNIFPERLSVGRTKSAKQQRQQILQLR